MKIFYQTLEQLRLNLVALKLHLLSSFIHSLSLIINVEIITIGCELGLARWLGHTPRRVMVFSFLPKKMCTLFQKNTILCLFLKNVSPSKRVICFILNNLPFPMVEGIAFYALYKSRVLVIPCKADDFCLFIGLPDEI